MAPQFFLDPAAISIPPIGKAPARKVIACSTTCSTISRTSASARSGSRSPTACARACAKPLPRGPERSCRGPRRVHARHPALCHRQRASRLHGLGAWRRQRAAACWRKCWRPGSTPISAAAITCRSKSSGRSCAGCASCSAFRKARAGCSSPARRWPICWRAGRAHARAGRSMCAATAWRRGQRLVAYASAAAHGCIAQAMDLSGLGSAALHVIPTNDQPSDRHRRARRAPSPATATPACTPFLVVGTAGTVDIGAIDDLAALAGIARAGRALVPRRRRHRRARHAGAGYRAAACRHRAGRLDRARFPQMGAGALRRRLHPGARRRAASRDLCRRRRPICGAKRAGWPPARPGPAISGPICRAASAR